MKYSSQFCYGLALTGFLGLFTLTMLWNTVLATHPPLPIAIMLLLTVSPLLIPMRGFLRGQPKQCVWLAYVSLPYFVHGCMEAYSNFHARNYALIEILLSLMIFFGVSFYVRNRDSRAAGHA